MNIIIRSYQPSDLPDMIRIWNEIVEDGVAFPQEDFLNEQTGSAFFTEQTYTAVAASNIHARHLYERLRFQQLGVIPGGFRMKDGHYEDICPYYHTL